MAKLKLDNYEKDILKAVENGEFKPYPKEKLEKMKSHFQMAAFNTIVKNKNITIRISENDLSKLKSKALETGIPYQTILGALIHQYVEGNIHLKV